MGMMVLACIGKIRGPACGKSENIIRIFQEKCGLQIPITANLKIVNNWMLHFFFVPEDTNLIRSQTNHPSMSMLFQTIR